MTDDPRNAKSRPVDPVEGPNRAAARGVIQARFARYLARKYPGTRWSDSDSNGTGELAADDPGGSLSALKDADTAIGE